MTSILKATTLIDPSSATDNIVMSSSGGVTVGADVSGPNGVNFGGTGALKIPSGTTAQRPASPAEGTIRYNTTTTFWEYYSSVSGWVDVKYQTDVITVNGTPVVLSSIPYTISSSGLYQIEVVAPITSTVRVEVWGAGGGGGAGYKGGAGGYARGEFTPSAGDTFSAIVGAAGPYAVNSRNYPDGGAGAGYGGGGGSTRFGPQVTSGNENNTSNVFYLIAGGGGGASPNLKDGVLQAYGGGTVGAPGGGYYGPGSGSNDGTDPFGKGGTQSAGGVPATTGRLLGYSQAGAKYSGGDGYQGGGGGYYGGSGGNGYYATGGGGSGYLHTAVMSNTAFATATGGSSTNYISPDPLGTRPTATTGYGGNGAVAGYDGGFAIYLV